MDLAQAILEEGSKEKDETKTKKPLPEGMEDLAESLKHVDDGDPSNALARAISEEHVDERAESQIVLGIPKNKTIMEMPYSHFVNLARRKGEKAITGALTRLMVENRRKSPEVFRKAAVVIKAIQKELAESVVVEDADYLRKKADAKYLVRKTPIKESVISHRELMRGVLGFLKSTYPGLTWEETEDDHGEPARIQGQDENQSVMVDIGGMGIEE